MREEVNTLGEVKLTFHEWVNDTYQTTWQDMKQEFIQQGKSYEVIMEEYFSLRDHYQWEKKNL